MNTIVVSGANRGIGLEFARQYAADGDRVIAGVRDPAAATELKAIPGVEVLALDTSDDASVKAFHAAVGDAPVDVLIANAGVYGGRNQAPGHLDFDGWRTVLDVNTLGPARLAEAFRPNLAAGRQKKLVAITSTLGSSSGHDGRNVVYRSSKAALNNVWAGYAAALKDEGIVCLPLHPGWVRTEMGGPSATITPERSVAGLRGVIARTGMEGSGKPTAYDGEPLPW